MPVLVILCCEASEVVDCKGFLVVTGWHVGDAHSLLTPDVQCAPKERLDRVVFRGGCATRKLVTCEVIDRFQHGVRVGEPVGILERRRTDDIGTFPPEERVSVAQKSALEAPGEHCRQLTLREPCPQLPA